MTALLPQELGELKSLLMIASPPRLPWQRVLGDAVAKGKPVYVRFGGAVHRALDKVGEVDETGIDQLSDFDSLIAYWELPPEEAGRLLHHDPPWKIEMVVRPAVFGGDSDPDKSWLEDMTPIDESALYLVPPPARKRTGPRSPSQIFIRQQQAEGITAWKESWRRLRDMADGKTLREFGRSSYLLRKTTVPHPKSLNGLLPAVSFEQDTDPPKTILIGAYYFRDSFEKVLKTAS
jgi:hypothetical protein